MGIVAHASDRKPFGMVIVNAMALKKPLFTVSESDLFATFAIACPAFSPRAMRQ
jgi:hypothetical protein